MATMNEFDPYAPPEADGKVGASKSKKKSKRAVPKNIADAIARLNEHLADPTAMALDRQEIGRRLRLATIGFIVAFIFVLITAIVVLSDHNSPQWEPNEFAIAIFSGFIGFLVVILVTVDLQLPRREKVIAPDAALKSFFRAITLGRVGYAWAMLSPTAREQAVEPPILGDIPVGEGSFVLRNTSNLKNFLQTFMRPGNGQMRTMQVKKVVLLREDGDVAICEVVAQFQAWPQWAQIVSVVAFVINRAAGAVVFLALYFSLRKVHDAVFRKTLIRGSNGIWYLYSADWFEKIERD